MDYGIPERRKSKNDKRAKARFNRFKRGGALRSANLPLREEKKKIDYGQRKEGNG